MTHTERPRHLLSLDLLRFACALLVALHHFGAVLPLTPAPFAVDGVRAQGLGPMLAPWTWFGWIGVELFFVLSGYVIAMSAEDRDARTFLRQRLLRLGPAVWICATITAATLLAGTDAPRRQIGGELLAAWTFQPFARPIDGSYWTLAIEWSFYLLVAGALAVRGPRVVEPLGLALAIASLAFWPQAGGWWREELGIRLPSLMLLAHGGFFAIGMASCAVRRSGWTPIRAATVGVGLFAGTVEIVGHAHFTADLFRLDAGPAVPLALFGLGLLPILFADRLQAALDRGIGRARLAFLGLVTYPFYLLHQNIGAVMILALMRRGLPQGPATMAALTATLVLAGLVTARVEPALRRALAGVLPERFSPSRGPAPDSLRTASPPIG